MYRIALHCIVTVLYIIFAGILNKLLLLCDIQMRSSMTSHGVHNILTYRKIVYIFKIIEQNHLKLCRWIQTTKRNNIVQVLILQ